MVMVIVIVKVKANGRTPELSNALLHMKQARHQQYREIAQIA